MFYKELLDSIIKSEKNPVNKMYLHEIKLKWDKFLKITKEKQPDNDLLVKSLNDFIHSLRQKKYKFNKRSKKGFNKNSALFQAYYLNDLLSIFVNKQKIIEKDGITWDFQPFSYNIRLDPNNLSSMSRGVNYKQTYSDKYLQLIQNIDAQYRVSGKRNFTKYKYKIPLIVFHTYKTLFEEDFLKCENSATKAKSTFKKSKTIIVTESLRKDFVPDIEFSPVDIIFILRKDFSKNKSAKISAQVVKELELKISHFLKGVDPNSVNFKNTGVIL